MCVVSVLHTLRARAALPDGILRACTQHGMPRLHAKLCHVMAECLLVQCRCCDDVLRAAVSVVAVALFRVAEVEEFGRNIGWQCC